MVDKVDKPEAPNPYKVTSPTESKGDKPKEERRQEDLPTYQQKQSSAYLEKFQTGSEALKTLLVPLERIQKLLFRRAIPHHGTPTVEADLIWSDGRITEGVIFLLKNWQDFLKIRNLKQKEEITPEYWNYRTPNLEVTIRIKTHSSGSWNPQDIAKAKAPAQKLPEKTSAPWKQIATALGILGGEEKKMRPLVLIAYGLGLVGLIILLILIIGI